MFIPKSQTHTANLSSKKPRNHLHTASLSEYDWKPIVDSPKFTAFHRFAQKICSPTQKTDLTMSVRSSHERSRREKSDAISVASLHTRTATGQFNNSSLVRNLSAKSQADSFNSKSNATNSSKLEKNSQQDSQISLKELKQDKRLNTELKKTFEKTHNDNDHKIQKTKVFLSPSAKTKEPLKIENSNKRIAREINSYEADVVSPKFQDTAIKSSSRNSSGRDGIKDINSTTSKSQFKPMGHHKKSLSMQETTCSSALSRRGEFPLDSKTASDLFGGHLSPYEREEIFKYEEIYFVGDRYHKLLAKDEQEFDDEKGDYLVIKNDQISYRYEVIEMLGRGSFGQVLKVYDHKEKEYLALKIIRSQKKFHFQAKIEVKMLCYMMEHHGCDYNITGLRDHFTFRNHMCIVFELMSLSLYDFLKKNKFRGFSLNVIRKFAIQVLYALKFLSQHNIIHCDLKPENILLKHSNKTGIKVIDFGSSCFDSEKLYTYIQSRFYRAPEVILGSSYSSQIDMWSFGCLLFELYVGQPVFPGESEQDQLLCMMEVLGTPEKSLIYKAPRKKNFFDDDYNPKLLPSSKGKIRVPGTTPIETLIRCEDKLFIDLIKCCLVFDPKKRYNASEALGHEWILGGLPPNLQAQHMKLIETTDYKNSINIKEDILNPAHNKQHYKEENLTECKEKCSSLSPKPNIHFKSAQLEPSKHETFGLEKSLEIDDLLIKNISDFYAVKNKTNSDAKSEVNEEVKVTNSMSQNNSKKFTTQQNIRKTHHKSESMAVRPSTKRVDSKINMMNNYFYINAPSQRFGNQHILNTQESERTFNGTKTKKGSQISTNTLEIDRSTGPYEDGNNATVNEVVTKDTFNQDLILKNASTKQLSTISLYDESNNSKFKEVSKESEHILVSNTNDKSGFKRINSLTHDKSATENPVSDELNLNSPSSNALNHSIRYNPLSKSSGTNKTNTNFSTSNLHSSAAFINSANNYKTSNNINILAKSMINMSSSDNNITDNLSVGNINNKRTNDTVPSPHVNNKGFNSGTVSKMSHVINTTTTTNNNQSISQKYSVHTNLTANSQNSVQSTTIRTNTINNNSLYNPISSLQQKKTQSDLKVDSVRIVSNNFSVSDSINTKEKFNATKSNAITSSINPHIHPETNIATNVSSSTLRNSQSTKTSDKFGKKHILIEKKFNSPNNPLSSPKVSTNGLGKSSLECKQDKLSISPRHTSYSKLKQTISRKK